MRGSAPNPYPQLTSAAVRKTPVGREPALPRFPLDCQAAPESRIDPHFPITLPPGHNHSVCEGVLCGSEGTGKAAALRHPRAQSAWVKACRPKWQAREQDNAPQVQKRDGPRAVQGQEHPIVPGWLALRLNLPDSRHETGNNLDTDHVVDRAEFECAPFPGAVTHC